jgi:hypothetical protein
MTEGQEKLVREMKVPEGAEETAIALLTLNLVTKLVTSEQFLVAVAQTEKQLLESGR